MQLFRRSDEHSGRPTSQGGTLGDLEDDLNTRSFKGATILNAHATWRVTGRLQLVARRENVTNQSVMAGINGDGSVERATPRTLWIDPRLR